MAVDTRNKRASVLGVAMAVTLVLPAPDGAVAAADQNHTAYSYAGITADNPVPTLAAQTCLSITALRTSAVSVSAARTSAVSVSASRSTAIAILVGRC